MYFKIKSYHLIKFISRIIICIYYCVKTHHRQPRTIPRPTPHLAPLPKGAGLRQDSIVSNISIFSDTHNAPILQTLSAVKTEGSPPRLSPLPQTSPNPHYQNSNPRRRRTTIIHYSLFITHLYHQCTISIPLVISIHGNYFHRIYYFCISHNIP